MAIIIQRACVIAFAGLMAGGVHSALPTPLKLRPAAPPPPQIVTTARPNDPNLPTPQPQALGLDITTPQAWELFQSGAAFIDARRRDEYLAGHVQGAFYLPSEVFYESGGSPEALNYLAKDQVLVIYCGGGACDASHNTAKLLQQAGFPRTHVMKDGYPSWTSAGHPIATGAPDYELGGTK
jgi:rhodanese-related sulfurtransferase